eukprot:1585089-Prymnesium_polylepis.3
MELDTGRRVMIGASRFGRISESETALPKRWEQGLARVTLSVRPVGPDGGVSVRVQGLRVRVWREGQATHDERKRFGCAVSGLYTGRGAMRQSVGRLHD